MKLYDHQSRAINMLYDWFGKNSTGNPVLVMPGGSGKSVVIADFVRDALKNWPDTKVLMLVHSRELVRQNANRLRQVWPNAPMGVYSASLNRRQLGEPITYAGIQSVRNRAEEIGHIDLCLCDEAHAISNEEEGTYRNFLAELRKINPNMRVVGLTASPYRMKQGYVTDGDNALFTDIIDPVSIEELVHKGFLAPLRSKFTDHKLETDGLHVRGGDYIASEMEAAFDTDDNNTHIVKEMIDKAQDRNHWLIFASGIDHAAHFSQALNNAGVSADYITSKDSTPERDRKLSEFESGQTRAMVNVGILTTGYDFQALDCIAFLRATKSPGLYLQCAVRGMRTHKGKEDCLVLDFAGVVEQHGPITAIQPPRKTGNGEAPVKVCDNCSELVSLSATICPCCGENFPESESREENPLKLRQDDIMGLSDHVMAVGSWAWRSHTSKSSGKDMVKVTYYPADLSGKPVTEYLPVLHGGLAGQKAVSRLIEIARSSGASLPQGQCSMWELADAMQSGTPPDQIHYKMEGKWPRVEHREWETDDAMA